jgi:hypothetical protein
MNTTPPLQVTAEYFGIAVIGSLRPIAGRITNVISAALVPLDDAKAARWFLDGLPIVLGTSQEAADAAQGLGMVRARQLAAEWKAAGIQTPVMHESEVVPEQLQLFAA